MIKGTIAGVALPALGARNRASLTIKAVIATATLIPLYLVFAIESPIPYLERLTAAALWSACLLPLWLAVLAPPAQRQPLPFLPVVGIAYGWYYALTVTYGAYNQHWRIHVEPDLDYAAPLRLALVGWLMLLIGYRVAGSGWYGIPWRTRSTNVPDVNMEKTGILFVLLGLPLSMLARFVELSPAFIGLAQFGYTAFLFGVSLLVIVQTSGCIGRLGRVVLWMGAGIAMLLALGEGFISPLIVLWAAILFSVWTVKHSLGARWTAAMIVVVLAAVLFKSVNLDFRALRRQAGVDLNAGAAAGTVSRLLQARIEREGIIGALGSGQKATSARSANLELFSDVIRRTPVEIPYWEGHTYLSLVGLVVPRVLWPDKPTKNLGQEFGKRYGYVDFDDYGTSFNLPVLVEFYANFGAVGVWLGMFIVGVIYRLLDRFVNRPGQPVVMSSYGLVLLLPLLNIESDFSLIFGGLFLNGVLLWYLLRVVQLRTRQPVARRPVDSRSVPVRRAPAAS